MTIRVGIVDSGRGNLKSLFTALEHLEALPNLIASPEEMGHSDIVILPGVGAIGDVMTRLRDRGLDDGIKRFVDCGRPILGICLGCQMLMTRSEEFDGALGLDLVHGSVIRIPESSEPIPNVGWKRLEKASHSQVRLPFPSARGGEWFYFVHSFYCVPDDPKMVLSAVNHGGNNIAAIIGKDNIFGFQFHPEKSGVSGLKLLGEFLRFVD